MKKELENAIVDAVEGHGWELENAATCDVEGMTVGVVRAVLLEEQGFLQYLLDLGCLDPVEDWERLIELFLGLNKG